MSDSNSPSISVLLDDNEFNESLSSLQIKTETVMADVSKTVSTIFGSNSKVSKLFKDTTTGVADFQTEMTNVKDLIQAGMTLSTNTLNSSLEAQCGKLGNLTDRYKQLKGYAEDYISAPDKKNPKENKNDTTEEVTDAAIPKKGAVANKLQANKKATAINSPKANKTAASKPRKSKNSAGKGGDGKGAGLLQAASSGMNFIKDNLEGADQLTGYIEKMSSALDVAQNASQGLFASFQGAAKLGPAMNNMGAASTVVQTAIAGWNLGKAIGDALELDDVFARWMTKDVSERDKKTAAKMADTKKRGNEQAIARLDDLKKSGKVSDPEYNEILSDLKGNDQSKKSTARSRVTFIENGWDQSKLFPNKGKNLPGQEEKQIGNNAQLAEGENVNNSLNQYNNAGKQKYADSTHSSPQSASNDPAATQMKLNGSSNNLRDGRESNDLYNKEIMLGVSTLVNLVRQMTNATDPNLEMN